jgi:hypothetical protein
MVEWSVRRRLSLYCISYDADCLREQLRKEKKEGGMA